MTFESGANLYLSADSYKAISNIEEQEGYEREQQGSSEKTEAELLYNKSNIFEPIKPKVIPPPRNYRTTPVQEFGVDMARYDDGKGATGTSRNRSGYG